MMRRRRLQFGLVAGVVVVALLLLSSGTWSSRGNDHDPCGIFAAAAQKRIHNPPPIPPNSSSFSLSRLEENLNLLRLHRKYDSDDYYDYGYSESDSVARPVPFKSRQLTPTTTTPITATTNVDWDAYYDDYNKCQSPVDAAVTCMADHTEWSHGNANAKDKDDDESMLMMMTGFSAAERECFECFDDAHAFAVSALMQSVLLSSASTTLTTVTPHVKVSCEQLRPIVCAVVEHCACAHACAEPWTVAHQCRLNHLLQQQHRSDHQKGNTHNDHEHQGGGLPQLLRVTLPTHCAYENHEVLCVGTDSATTTTTITTTTTDDAFNASTPLDDLVSDATTQTCLHAETAFYQCLDNDNNNDHEEKNEQAAQQECLRCEESALDGLPLDDVDNDDDDYPTCAMVHTQLCQVQQSCACIRACWSSYVDWFTCRTTDIYISDAEIDTTLILQDNEDHDHDDDDHSYNIDDDSRGGATISSSSSSSSLSLSAWVQQLHSCELFSLASSPTTSSVINEFCQVLIEEAMGSSSTSSGEGSSSSSTSRNQAGAAWPVLQLLLMNIGMAAFLVAAAEFI